MKRILSAFAIILIFIFGLLLLAQMPTAKIEYELIEVTADAVLITASVNIRADPKVIENRGDGTTNSYGILTPKEPGATVFVSKVYFSDRLLDENGGFCGFSVKEAETSPSWEMFPQLSTRDGDGIIWVNLKYAQVIGARQDGTIETIKAPYR